MAFHKDSAFGQEATNQRLFEHISKPIPVGHAKVGPPLEHWHHDLITVDILLEQSPPDIDRARDMLRDIADEIRGQLNGK